MTSFFFLTKKRTLNVDSASSIVIGSESYTNARLCVGLLLENLIDNFLRLWWTPNEVSTTYNDCICTQASSRSVDGFHQSSDICAIVAVGDVMYLSSGGSLIVSSIFEYLTYKYAPCFADNVYNDSIKLHYNSYMAWLRTVLSTMISTLVTAPPFHPERSIAVIYERILVFREHTATIDIT